MVVMGVEVDQGIMKVSTEYWIFPVRIDIVVSLGIGVVDNGGVRRIYKNNAD